LDNGSGDQWPYQGIGMGNAPQPGGEYSYDQNAYPEYAATEYAPGVEMVPYVEAQQQGPYDEPTRIYIPGDESQQQARVAAEYQAQIEAVYPQAPVMDYGYQYAQQQAYAPHAYVEQMGSIPQGQSLAIIDSGAGASRIVVVYPTAVTPPSPELLMVQRPDTVTADQYRMLRFKLLDRPSSQLIAVTSPTKGVGASVTAANLALSLAEAGRARVVLVDTDVRNARQSRIFGIESDVGLTVELERRHADPDISVRVVAVAATMAILPAGHDVPNPTAMLGSDVMARLLEDLRYMYDHIVLDVAAVLDRSDAAAIHNLVDTFVLVALSGVTTTDDIEKAEEKLPRKKVAGVVLNSMPKQPKGLVRGLIHLMQSPGRRRKYIKRGKNQ
jgi:capsular exopolysaccharide synthesis family protein